MFHSSKDENTFHSLLSCRIFSPKKSSIRERARKREREREPTRKNAQGLPELHVRYT